MWNFVFCQQTDHGCVHLFFWFFFPGVIVSKRLEKRLLQLPGNNPTVSPWQTVFNGPAGSMSEHHSKNPATGASWFYVGSFNHRADFHDSTNSREDHRVPTESIYCLRWLPCCIWLSRSKSSLADSRVDWPTREILQTSQGAAPWDGELCTSKWSAQPVLSNHDRGAPRMCSGPRALQCHHRLRYDKNHFTSQLWAQIRRSYHFRCRFCRWLGHSGGLHGAAAGSAPNSARRGCQSRTAYKLEQN